jgi:hypothetical protein
MDRSNASNSWWFKIRQLVGFVRKIRFHHYIRVALCKQVHHIVAKTTHFTIVTFKIMVLIGCRRKLRLDIRKNNAHTPLPSRTQRDWAEWLPRCSSTLHPHSLSQCSPPWQCKYLSFSRSTAAQTRSRSKFDNSPLYNSVFLFVWIFDPSSVIFNWDAWSISYLIQGLLSRLESLSFTNERSGSRRNIVIPFLCIRLVSELWPGRGRGFST